MLTRLALNNKGFSLVEIMVALTASSFLALATMSVAMTSVNHAHTSIEKIRLNNDMRTIMDLMVNEIRRHGYWGGNTADIATSANTNPFQAAGMDLSINTDADCILFSYDYDLDGSVATIGDTDGDERYGFRLQNSAIEMRPNGAGFSCTATDWDTLTDASLITFTGLSFTQSDKDVEIVTGSDLKVREITISMTAEITGETESSRTISETVRIRNDKFVVGP